MVVYLIKPGTSPSPGFNFIPLPRAKHKEAGNFSFLEKRSFLGTLVRSSESRLPTSPPSKCHWKWSPPLINISYHFERKFVYRVNIRRSKKSYIESIIESIFSNERSKNRVQFILFTIFMENRDRDLVYFLS